MIRLSGRTVLITGAGSGIGRALALLSVEFGASVTAVDVDERALESLSRELPESALLTVTGSVSDPDLAPLAIARTVARFGAVHGLVNNAGIVRAAMIHKMSREQWSEVLAVNASGAF